MAASDFGSQRLFRLSYRGPEGEGSLKATLRLVSPDSYQVEVVDPIGRTLWSLTVAQGQGLWLDHRNHAACAFRGRLELSGLPLGVFPLLSLPALLLGRVPAAPAGPAGSAEGPREGGQPGPPALSSPPPVAGSVPSSASPASPSSSPSSGSGQTFSYEDAEGRRWDGVVAGDGELASWTLSEGGKQSLGWVSSDGWRTLTDRTRGVQLRWKEVLREPLRRPLPTTVSKVPAGYREVPCAGSEAAPTGARPAPGNQPPEAEPPGA